MKEDAKEGEDNKKEKSSRKRKVLVFLIVLNILLVGFVVFWYFELKPWTIWDVSEAAGLESEDEWAELYGNPQIRNPGFSSDLEGKEITVSGRVTDIRSIQTTLGPLTYYELDDFEFIHLIEWKEARYSIGNVMEKRVRFEQSHYNQQYNVYSPQLDFPVMDTAPTIEATKRSTNYNNGMILLVNQSESRGPVKIFVKIPHGDGIPLELIQCTLKEGTEGHMFEMNDAFRGYRDNSIIGSITSLSNKTGINDNLHFIDANQNDLFDDGDHFTINVSKPKTNSAILTYLFTLEDRIQTLGSRMIEASYYLVMTKKGVFSALSTITGEDYLPTFSTTNTNYQYMGTDNVTMTIDIEEVIGKAPQISKIYCYIYDGGNNVYIGDVDDEPFIVQTGIEMEYFDNNDNSLIDVDDRVIISNMRNNTDYELTLYSGTVSHGKKFLKIKGITGIGVGMENIPYVHFGDPVPINPPDTGSVRIGIQKIYGYCGMNLSAEYRFNWFMVRASKDHQEVLSPTRLIPEFDEELAELNITFIDSDNNDYLNPGDYFLCQTNQAGEYTLNLDYVDHELFSELGFEIVYSRSASWTVP
jgi:hypothetical protein